jgi:circadian clock protein KaiC
MPTNMSDTASTGVSGLDFILRGGLPRGRAYLLQGGPGTGKTTLSLQFLLNGVQAGERTLFITLSQSERDLQLIAHSHGWSLARIDISEVTRRNFVERLTTWQNVIHPADVQLDEVMAAVRNVIQTQQPDRLVFDSIGVIRALAGELKTRYLEEIALVLELVHEQEATALFVDEMPAEGTDIAFQNLVHGVIELDRQRVIYGADHHWLYVHKMRGLNFLTGQHNYAIRTGGLEVFPRLQQPKEEATEEQRLVTSDVETLDTILGGGLQAGTSSLIVGSAGTGKTSLATAYTHAALRRGDKAAIFLFDERPETFLMRSKDLHMDLRPFLQSGQLHLQSVDTGELTPGEFAQTVRRTADAGARVITIDSLTGYFLAMQEQEMLTAQMHDLLGYMSRRGVLSLLIVALHGLPGMSLRSSIDISYLADTIIMLRNYEVPGAVRRAVAVVIKRYGEHEPTIRELKISARGIELGEPIDQFIGVLTGEPTYTEQQEARRHSRRENQE